MPLSVVLLPAVVGAVMPNKIDAICFAAVAVPIAALIIRYVIGRRTIASNRVGPVVRACQYCVFTAAIVVLVFMDFMVVLLHIGDGVRAQVFYILGAGYALYLVAMSFAMFPGWTEALPTQTSDSHTDTTVAEPSSAEGSPGPRYHLILMNDDTHSYDYVVRLLQLEFGLPFAKALVLTHAIDANGQAVVFTGPRGEVDLRRERVLAAGPDPAVATSTGPLRVVVEQAESGDCGWSEPVVAPDPARDAGS